MTLNTDQVIELIYELINKVNDSSEEYISQFLIDLVKLIKMHPSESDSRLLRRTIDEVISSIEVFQDYREVRKVCIFGSARCKEDHPNYILTEEVASELTNAGFMTITGAGPGIMEAGNKGAGENGSFGLNILLPFEQEPNKYIKNSEKLISYRYFFTRKLFFLKESHAIILFPGGFGTQDEGFEVLTLIQTGRCSPRPVVLINSEKSDYWKAWLTYVQTQLLDRHYISPEDMCFIRQVDTAQEAVAEVATFYSIYHSIVYLNKLTSIRLNKALSPEFIQVINDTYNDILIDGVFSQHDAIDVEEDCKIHPEKKRLVFHFNKSNYGRICSLVYFINENA